MQNTESQFAQDVEVRGRLDAANRLIVATLDERPHSLPHHGEVALTGIGAFDADAGGIVWRRWGLPALAAVTDHAIYAYSRSGLVVALNADGSERWRTSVPDDRSEAAQARGDRDGPFVGDVLPCGSVVTLAAGNTLLQLAAETGAIVTQARACGAERGVISRITLLKGCATVATCTQRTVWDDETERIEPKLWQPTPTLESLRTSPGTAAAFNRDLRSRWILASPTPGIVYGDLRPAAAAGDTVVFAASGTAGEGAQRYVSAFHDRLVAVDGNSGAVLWQRDMPGGRGYFDPLATTDGIVAGYELTYYSLADGAVRWQLSAREVEPLHVAPVLDGERLLVASKGSIRSIVLSSGAITELARFAANPALVSITTNLLLKDGRLFLGVKEHGYRTQLLSIRLNVASKNGR
jgi:outer membrane protein assembly factor BamB